MICVPTPSPSGDPRLIGSLVASLQRLDDALVGSHNTVALSQAKVGTYAETARKMVCRYKKSDIAVYVDYLDRLADFATRTGRLASDDEVRFPFADV